MATLSDTDRLRVYRGLMRLWSAEGVTIVLSKSDLLAAVVATDDWIDAAQSSYNSALPSVAQSGLTSVQKILLFCAVALARASIQYLRRVFGEVE